MSNSPEIKDFLGRTIIAGNSIVYPVRRGAEMSMKRLSVTQVVGGPKPYITGYNDLGRRVTLKNINNVTVVEPLPHLKGDLTSANLSDGV